MAVRALRTLLVYYISGFVIALLVHLFVGWEIRVLMPRSVLVILLFMLGAMPWFLLNVTNLFVPRKRAQNLQELILHSVLLTLMFSVIFIIYHVRV